MSEHETAWPELACVSDGGAAAHTCGRRKRAAQDPDTAQASAGRNPGAVDNVATVQDNAARYTKREMAAANEARDLMTLQGVPSADIIKMMRDGTGHLRAATGYHQGRGRLGQPIADFKGRSTAAKPAIPQEQPHVVRVHQEFHTDLLFVSGQPYVLTLMQPMHYCSWPNQVQVSARSAQGHRQADAECPRQRHPDHHAALRQSQPWWQSRPTSTPGVTLNTTAEGGPFPPWRDACARSRSA
jgi:hypothetical protein